MGLHADEVSMLREALPEYLALAELGAGAKKSGGGILGYPTAALLLAVVDAIGSYVRDAPDFTVVVDGEKKHITETSDHILVLNSEFFGLALTEDQLRDIYRLCRSPLTHNAVIGNGHVLVPGQPTDAPFTFAAGHAVTSVAGLLVACNAAVEVFLQVAADIVPTAEATKELRQKAVKAASKRTQSGKLAFDITSTPTSASASATATGPTNRARRT